MPEDEISTPDINPKKPYHWAKIGIFFSTLGIVIIICALGYGYFQLARVNIKLAQMIGEVQTQSENEKNDINNLQQSITDLKQTIQKNEASAAEQEKLMTELRSTQKGDFDKYHAAEAQYLVKLASDHIQYTHDTATAAMLLQRANQVLQNVTDPKLSDVRQSLAKDIASLQVLPEQDVTQLYMRLSILNDQIDKLPLHFNPIKSEAAAQTQPTPATGTEAETTWWRQGLDRSWQALRQIVVVRNMESNSMPLVFPEERVFLYQNLHAQLESAMWAVLHRNPQVYQASLTRVSAWIEQYFDPNAQETKTVLETLQALQKINIETPAVNLSNTLQLFANYFAQNGAGTVTQ